MSYVVLARKWRPMSFADLVGQDHVSRTLGSAIEKGRVAHAFLFTGVRGVGKTTSARILAKALNCMGDPDSPRVGDPGPTVNPCLKCSACKEIAEGSDIDVREIDGASYNGVDEVRKLQDSLPYRPTRDRFKIIIVDEVHMLSGAAWNAFLKTLEEPPPHVKFIFATTEAHKVPITILSRVQRFDFKLIPTRVIAERLRYVLEQENVKADESAVVLLARQAAGSMRDGMSLLDQVIAFGGDELRGEDVAQVLGVASRSALLGIARALVSGAPEECVRLVGQVADQGFDINHVARDLLALLRDLVVAKICENPGDLVDLADEERAQVLALSESATENDLLRLHQGFSRGFDDITRGADPRANLEMLLVRLALRPPLLPVDELLYRLGALEKRLSGAAPRPRTTAAKSGPPSPPALPPERSSPRARAPATGARPERGGTVDRAASPTEGAGDDADPDGPAAELDDFLPIEPPEAAAEAFTWEAAGREPVGTATAGSPTGPAQPATPATAAGTALPASGALPAGAANPARAREPRKKEPRAKSFDTPEPERAAAGRTSDHARDDATLAAAPSQEPPREPLPAVELGDGEVRLISEMMRVCDALRADHMELVAYLEQTTPIVCDGTSLVIALEPGFLFESHLSSKQNRELLRTALSAVWKTSASFDVEKESARAQPHLTVAFLRRQQTEQARQSMIEEVRNHPRVKRAVELLGARVREVHLPDELH